MMNDEKSSSIKLSKKDVIIEESKVN